MGGMLICGDSLRVMSELEPRSVDLVFGSPPYEDCRDIPDDPFPVYKGQAWVDWMIQYYERGLYVSKGLVAFVMQGKTRNFKWSPTPALLIADLHRAGFNLRRPPIFQRYGVPGSGGKDWLKCNYEFIVTASHPGKLHWSDNTACGHPPKYGPGGPCSNRKKDGSRVNQWGNTGKLTERQKDGKTTCTIKPSHVYVDPNKVPKDYVPPVLCNPGDVINCGAMGKGHMGSDYAHKNEAPFPEQLAEFFIRTFVPPGGTVLDPFSGSGTTCAVAKKLGRNYIGIDIRESQTTLARARLQEST